ncbi:transposase InsO family protein [Paraburkholderia sp. WSM4179]|nr:transposase InsO family protein [Paraburkholderia sp. WSM4179]
MRDVMLAAVEQRFGTTGTGARIELLSDNGSAYIDHARAALLVSWVWSVDYTRSIAAE